MYWYLKPSNLFALFLPSEIEGTICIVSNSPLLQDQAVVKHFTSTDLEHYSFFRLWSCIMDEQTICSADSLWPS